MNMSIYNFFAPANTIDNLLERNKNLLEENKRLKMKINALKNPESNNSNPKYKVENNEIQAEEDGNNIENNEMDIDDPPKCDSPLKKRKNYSILSKYRILQELDNKKTSEVAKKYNIPLSTFKGWKKNEDKYKELILKKEGNKQRLEGGGRKITDPEYEIFLVNWIKSERQKKNQISYFRFIKYAKENYKGNTLKFSIGWLQKFLLRNNFSYRKRTSTCFIDENIITKKINEEFFPELYSFIVDNPNKTIFYNMDEIRIELDCISDKTIDVKGIKYVPIKNSNSERKAYTIALCISNRGRKLKPFILFDGKGTNLLKQLDPKNTIIEFTQKLNGSYMNADLFKKWCEKIYDAEVNLEEKNNSILLLDNCGSIHDKFSPKDTQVFFFPANSTKYLQPLDLGVNKIFKGKFKIFWEEWMANNNKTTSSGYTKSMDRQTFINAVSRIWEEIEQSVIINSFNEITKGLKKIDEDLNNNIIE